MKTPIELASDLLKQMKSEMPFVLPKPTEPYIIEALTIMHGKGYEAAQPKWISVDTPPKDNVNVIGGNCEDEWTCEVYFDGNKWYNGFDTDGECEIYPTHWMNYATLPSPPKTT